MSRPASDADIGRGTRRKVAPHTNNLFTCALIIRRINCIERCEPPGLAGAGNGEARASPERIRGILQVCARLVLSACGLPQGDLAYEISPEC